MDFKDIKLERILSNDPLSKQCSILVDAYGELGRQPAILTLTKSPYTDSDSILNLIQYSATDSNGIEKTEQNDIYHHYNIGSGTEKQELRIIYPATSIHISKYSYQKTKFVKESPDMYNEIVKPWILQQPQSKTRWILNIFEGSSEAENILFRKNECSNHSGFIILPDSKWNGECLESLYLLVIVKDSNIKSLRDLHFKHLPLLKDIKSCVKCIVHKKYSIHIDSLRLYLHYQPTYYHLHVHVVNIGYSAPKCQVGSSHLLDDVIDNIENVSNEYYQKRTLFYELGSEHPLTSKIICHAGTDDEDDRS